MLPDIKLDTADFQDLVEEYRAVIAGIYPEWTNYNYSDPGMTFLELFAWLMENQQFHMEQLGASHYEAFCRLLGAEKRKRQPARILVLPCEKHPLQIQPKSRFFAGGMAFETVEEENIPEGILMKAVVKDKNGRVRDQAGSHLLSCPGEMRFAPFGRKPETGHVCQLFFSEPLLAHKVYHLSFLLASGRERRRNPLKGPMAFPLARLEWSYYSPEGWRPFLWVKDETSQFLFDGRIGFALGEDMALLPKEEGEGYSLRVELKENSYDIPPVFSAVVRDSVLLVQKETWEGREPFVLAEGNGFPCQEYKLPFPQVMSDSVKLQVEDPFCPGHWRDWEQVEDFSGSSPEDLCYQINEEQGTVVFGDGYYGMPPEGEIRLLALESTWGGECSIKEKTQVMWGEEKFFVFSEVSKGQNPETAQQAMGRQSTERPQLLRAVTRMDYETLVRETPGLMIYSCKVLKDTGIGNQVHIVVRPGDGRRRLSLGEAYRKNILRYLEDKRLMGTRIQLYAPEYIEVSVYMEVSPMAQFPRAKEQIVQAVEEWFGGLGVSFGIPVSYGALYGRVDGLDCVRRLCALSLTARSPGVQRNGGGDLIPPANGVFLLEQVEYVEVSG